MAQNWKTTTAGVLAILIAIGQAIMPWLQTGAPIAWGTIAATVATGIGLLVAADHNAPSAPSGPR